MAAYTAEQTIRQRKQTLLQQIAEESSPDHPIGGNMDLYYGLLGFGDGQSQPGAELNSGWYERNAKIFAKLISVAKPGDKIVVVFGSGHAYWLRHFVSEHPRFRTRRGCSLLTPVNVFTACPAGPRRPRLFARACRAKQALTTD